MNWVTPVVTATYQPGGFSVPALWTSVLVGSNETRYFRYSFDLPGTPTSATLHLAQDDDVDFAINGQTVYTDDNGFAGGSPALDVLAQLHPGINHFDVQLINTQCCGAGLGVHLDIAFEPRAGVPEPTTLLLMGAGLAGLGLGASRRRSGRA